MGCLPSPRVLFSYLPNRQKIPLSLLTNPTPIGYILIELDIRGQRREFVPFFEVQLSRHISLDDKDFGEQGGRSQLPL